MFGFRSTRPFASNVSNSKRRASRRIHDALKFAIESLESRTLLSAGDLDPTFGVGGKSILNANEESASAVIALPGGKTVIAGFTAPQRLAFAFTEQDRNFLLERFNADGSVDTTFGNAGRAIADFGADDFAEALAVTASGGFVVVGTSLQSNGNSSVAVARFTSAGALDTSFSGDGIATFSFGSVATANDVLIQADGKIEIAGGANADFLLARVTTAGSLDGTFGTQSGFTTLDFGASDESFSLALAPDGKLVLGGSSGALMAFARFSATGVPDNSFSGDAKQTYDILTGGNRDCVNDVVVLADGKILATGVASTDDAFQGQDLALLRLDSDGSLDGSFGGGDGIVTTNFPTVLVPGNPAANQTSYESGDKILFQSDGKIVVAGHYGTAIVSSATSWGVGSSGFAAARYSADGQLDDTFGQGGTRSTPFTIIRVPIDAALLSGDRLFLVGGSQSPTVLPFEGSPILSTQIVLARYTAGGAADTTFGLGGQLATPYDSVGKIYKVVAQLGGKILVAGGTLGPTGRSGFFVARYNADGTFDKTFSGDGRASVPVGTLYATATDLVVQSDGKIVLGGRVALDHGQEGFGLARFNVNGSLDTTFGFKGTRVTALNGSSHQFTDIAVLPDDRIVVAGWTVENNITSLALIRYMSNGVLDPTFGPYQNGKVLTPIVNGTLVFYPDFKVVPDGNDVFVGGSISQESIEFAIWRFKTDGTLDSNFGNNGIVTTNFSGAGSSGSRDFLHELIPVEGGKLLALGYSQLTSSDTLLFAMARYTSAGVPDSTFGTDGKILGPANTNVGIIPFDWAVLQSDGKIVSNTPANNVYRQFVVSRRTSDGNPDPSFADNGEFTDIGIEGVPSLASQINFRGGAIDAQGNILVGGRAGLNFLLFRLQGDQASTGPVQLTGTVIGTTGSYHNLGNTRDKAFDNDLNTFFDAPTASGAWVGLDLGSPRVITEVRYAPRADKNPGRMLGGVFQGSNTADFSSGVVTLYNIGSLPANGVLTAKPISNPNAFRYVRYVGADNTYCNVAEIQFWNVPPVPPTKLSGTVIGTAGSYKNLGNTRDKAFDGDMNTFFDAPTSNGNWVGLDLGTAKTITKIRFIPRGGFTGRMVGGIFQASNTADFSSGVVNLFTINSRPPFAWQEVVVSDPATYRYVRYLSPDGSFGDVAEIEFYGN